jgi:hypothetical protein
MNCLEFERRLHEQFLPSRLVETADLAEHAEHCSECRDTLEQFRVLSDGLSTWREQIPEVDLTGAVVLVHKSDEDFLADCSTRSVVRPLPPRPGRSRHSESTVSAGIVASSPWRPGRYRSLRAAWLAAAGAAGLLLVAVYFSRPGNDPPRSITETLAAKAPDAVAEASPVEPAKEQPAIPAVDRAVVLPEAAREVYYDLAQKAAGALGEVTVFVMPGSSPPKMTPRDEHPERPTDWIDGLQHRLQPIGRSLDDAFDFLWQAGEAADG